MYNRRVSTLSTPSDLRALLTGASWVALTGAGISTDSGIPDYRGPQARPAKPMLYDEFVGSEAHRRRYWARSMLGWTVMDTARPNAGHKALAALSDRRLRGIVTQNVDGLHQAAGSADVLELHGSIARVVCLDCLTPIDRDVMQQALEDANPGWRDYLSPAMHGSQNLSPERLRPDGDAEIAEWQWVRLVTCGVCGGMLKPDVVFFGEPVPRARSRQAYGLVDSADVLVVAGSSLTVMSGLKYVRHHVSHGKPVALINRGPTRADEIATIKIEAGTSEVLTELAATLR